MKELLKPDSKLRRAQCAALAELEKAMEAVVAVLFRRPSRRCSNLDGKIKMHCRIQSWRHRVRRNRSRLRRGYGVARPLVRSPGRPAISLASRRLYSDLFSSRPRSPTLSTSSLFRDSNADSGTAVTAIVSPSALNTSIE